MWNQARPQWQAAQRIAPGNAGAFRPPAANVQQGTIKPAKGPQPQFPNSSFIVYSTAERDHIGMRTLAGEFEEVGTNHGVKYYKKMNKIGNEDVDVFLYFWDERDGAQFSGWWFGNEVGGSQVWSRNLQKTGTPPRSGWMIPWDGEVRSEVVVANCAQLRQGGAPAMIAAKTPVEEDGRPAAVIWEERVQKATERAAEVELDTSEAMEAAQATLEAQLDEAMPEIDQAAVSMRQQELATVTRQLAEAQRFMATEGLAAQKAPGELKQEMAALGQRVRKLQATVKDMMGQLSNVKRLKEQKAVADAKKAEDEVKTMQLEAQQHKQFEELIPVAMEKIDVVEDEIEKVTIAAAPLQVEIEEALRPMMMSAIDETEKRVRGAQAGLAEAIRFIAGKIAVTQKWAEGSKKIATEELEGLKSRLDAAAARLEPYKNTRQDYQDRINSQQFMLELNEKLAGVEIEVEKVVMVAGPLNDGGREGIQETETALGAAQSTLSQTSRAVQGKLKIYEAKKGAVYEDLKSLSDRVKELQGKLDEIRKTLKESQVRTAADSLLQEVTDKVSTAEDELTRLGEMDLPLEGIGENGQSLGLMIAKSEKMEEKAQSAISEAQTFVAKKLLEVARFTDSHGKAVREDLALLQKRLEEGKARLSQLKGRSVETKRNHILGEIETTVSKTENEVKALTEATTTLKTVGEAEEAHPDTLKEIMEKASASERSAQAALVEAKKVLLLKTADLKKISTSGSGSGAELGKFQTRVNNMQQEIANLRNASKEAEERVRVKQMLGEVRLRSQITEKEVDAVSDAAAPIDDTPWTLEEVEKLEKSITSATTKLTATSKLVDVKLKSAQGFFKGELSTMKTKLTQLENKLLAAASSAAQQRQRFTASDIVEQAQEKIENVNTECDKMAEAELPFLKGIETEDASYDVLASVTAVETSASDAAAAISDAKSFIEEKLREVKKFTSKEDREGCSQKLSVLMTSLDGSTSKVSEVKASSAERRRTGQMQAATSKVRLVEESVTKLSETVEKFEQGEKAGASPEEMGKICEEMSGVEKASHEAVATARKFLAESLKEIQSFPESSREAMTAELTKLQPRLTQAQVEIAKRARQCTEREQRYVAKTLVRAATETVAAAEEKATKGVESGDSTKTMKDLKGASAEKLAKICAEVGQVEKAAHEAVTHAKDFLAKSLKEIQSFTEAQKEPLTVELTKLQARLSQSEGDIAKRAKEATEKEQGAVAEALVKTATDAVVAAEEKSTKLVDKGKAEEALKALSEAKTVVSNMLKSYEELRGASRSLLLQPRVELTKLATRASTAERRCAAAAEAKTKAQQQEIKASISKAQTLLRAEVRRTGTSSDELFAKFAAGKDVMTEAQFAKFVGSCSDAGLSKEQVGMMFKEYGPEGLRKIGFARIVQEFCTCAKATAITDKFEIDGSNMVRKLMMGELFQVLEGPSDDATGVSRVRGRALRDGVEGWVSSKGNEGTLFLKATEKPYMSCVSSVSLREKFDASSKMVGQAAKDEILELMEGPREEAVEPVVSLHGKCSTGEGWITVKSAASGVVAEPSKDYYVCKAVIAMTDVQDIKKAKPVKKVAPGEALQVIGGREDGATEISRLQFRAVGSGKEGWVSLKGNQGTIYLEPSSSHYVLLKDAQLRKGAEADSAQIGQLKAGEAFQALAKPTEVTPEPKVGLLARTDKEGKLGWVLFGTKAAPPVKPCNPK